RNAHEQSEPAAPSGNTGRRPDEVPPRWRAWLPPRLSWPVWPDWLGWPGWVGRPGGPVVGAGLAAVVVGLLFAAYQLIGRSSDGGASALEARVAGLERQLRELAGRTPTPGVDVKVIDDLTSRIAKLEATILGLRPSAIDPTLLNRIATVEGALK